MNENSYCYKYPHPAVTTDCVIITWDDSKLKVLLIRRGIEPYKDHWALPGGFMRMDETAEQCASRELFEETGLVAMVNPTGAETGFGYLSQLGAFTDVDRDPRERVVTIAFYALVKIDEVRGGDDASEACWIPIDEIPELAFDHKKILDYALERIREDIHFRPLGFQLLPEVFTMPQLQALYEAVLNTSFDRRNFAKKMLSLGLLRAADSYTPSFKRKMPSEEACFFSAPTPVEEDYNYCASFESDMQIKACRAACEKETSKAGREPNLYVFDQEKYDELKSKNINRLEF